MKLLLELSMECESLARAEAISAAAALGGRPRVLVEEPGVLVMETGADPVRLAARLGLCHYVDEWIASCDEGDVDACVDCINVPGPIRVRSTKVGEKTVDLAGVSRRAGAILGRRDGVDLHRPKSDVRIVFSDRVHIGRAIAAIDRPSFERRKNRYLPYVYPASLHPKYARALVNLTRSPPGARVLDPFCGTGAIVAEASLIGMRAVGSDFAEKMIEGADANLSHLKAEAELVVCDVGEVGSVVGKVDGIATDPPYGRATTTDGEGIPELYARAFGAFSGVLPSGGRTAIVVPDLGLVRRVDGFRLVEKHALWVHRSLTRHFCVFEKD